MASSAPDHLRTPGLISNRPCYEGIKALEVADRFADWFHRWTEQLSREQMDDLLDVETGGMLEAWADLYGATGEPKYLDLMERYTRSRLFEPLLDGQDPLTNQHANTTDSRSPWRRARLRGHRGRALAQNCRGLLEMCRHQSGNVLHRWPDLRRSLDSAV